MSKPSIDFTNKDFSSVKQALLNYAKIYYPETYKNFNEASFGALIFDNMSHIADILSFHIDYHGNESFIDSAIQIDNIEKLAKQLGYNKQGNGSSQGKCEIYIKIPADNYSQPNRNYLPVLKKDSQILAKDGSGFLLLEDVDFTDDSTEFVVVELNQNGVPVSFAAKQIGHVISGEKNIQTTETINFYDGFLKIKISNENFTEILSVVDSFNNEYYQVDYLSQNIIYKQILNTDLESKQYVKYKLQKIPAPRRFIIEKIGNFYYLVFGKGSIDSIENPSNIALNMHARNYSSDTFFDPSKILESDKFGIAPIGTYLNIIYRSNSTIDTNINVNSLSSVVNGIFEFPQTATSQAIIDSIQASIEVSNSEPILGFVQDSNIDELKQRSKDAYASQGRAVNQNDYISLIYKMDSKYGSIKRANIVKDRKSIRNNLNLYILSEVKVDGYDVLINSNDVLKHNLKQWIETKKMISDTIDILDAKIINLQITFKVHGRSNKDKKEIETECMEALIDKFSIKSEIGQPFDISSIYKTLNLLPSVVDTKDVTIEVLNGFNYNYNNFDINKHLSSDESFIECPDDVCFEVKFPNKDIKPIILKLI